MKKIYISDLDGTLLQDDATLSDYAKEELTDLLLSGVNFTVASARSGDSIRDILSQLPLKLPVIEFNGAYLSNYQTGEHEIINSIEEEVVLQLFNLIKEFKLLPIIASFDGKRDRMYYQSASNKAIGEYIEDKIKKNYKPLTQVVDLKEILREKVVRITLLGTKEELMLLFKKIERRYASQLEIYFFQNRYTGWYWLMMQDKKATKAYAIKQLLDKYGFAQEGLTVFGDAKNDLHMFKLAPNSIAVGNAESQLKKYASKVIGDNIDDSVTKYIKNSESS